jgi:hypothetical protein
MGFTYLRDRTVSSGLPITATHGYAAQLGSEPKYANVELFTGLSQYNSSEINHDHPHQLQLPSEHLTVTFAVSQAHNRLYNTTLTMFTRIMYSWLDSSDIQPIVPFLKEDSTAIKNEQKEVQTTPKVSWPEAAPVPKTRAAWDDRPSSYIRPVYNATIDEDSTEPRLLYPNYRHSTLKFSGNLDDPGVFMKAQNFKKIHPHNDTHYADCTAQEIKRCEQISRHPHPNLAQYLGVETKKIDGGERVTRIVCKR